MEEYCEDYRLIAEGMVGRKLKPEEIVHHLDKNRANNKPENLYVCQNNEEHGLFHSNRLTMICPFKFKNKRFLVFIEHIFKNKSILYISPNHDGSKRVNFEYNSLVMEPSLILKKYFNKVGAQKINKIIDDIFTEYYQDFCKYCNFQIEKEFLYCPNCDSRLKD